MDELEARTRLASFAHAVDEVLLALAGGDRGRAKELVAEAAAIDVDDQLVANTEMTRKWTDTRTLVRCAGSVPPAILHELAEAVRTGDDNQARHNIVAFGRRDPRASTHAAKAFAKQAPQIYERFAKAWATNPLAAMLGRKDRSGAVLVDVLKVAAIAVVILAISVVELVREHEREQGRGSATANIPDLKRGNPPDAHVREALELLDAVHREYPGVSEVPALSAAIAAERLHCPTIWERFAALDQLDAVTERMGAHLVAVAERIVELCPPSNPD